MSITKIDVYGDEERSVNSSKNRIAVFVKTDMQKRFEKWLSQISEYPAVGVMFQCNQSRVLGD
jgi:hypothetical protein